MTAENWRKACEHVEVNEQLSWGKHGLTDEIADELIINLEESESKVENQDSFETTESELENEQPWAVRQVT